MFIELELGGVFDICHYLAPDDEGKPREDRVPPSEVPSSLPIFFFLLKMEIFLPI